MKRPPIKTGTMEYCPSDVVAMRKNPKKVNRAAAKAHALTTEGLDVSLSWTVKFFNRRTTNGDFSVDYDIWPRKKRTMLIHTVRFNLPKNRSASLYAWTRYYDEQKP